MLRSIDIMTQVCYEGTYFGAQHILDPANNSSWAGHTVAAMLAIWDYPKSWAHLATLPFPKPEDFSVCAVLALHVPNSGIHTLWRFPCASIYPSLFFIGQQGKCLLVLVSPWR